MEIIVSVFERKLPKLLCELWIRPYLFGFYLFSCNNEGWGYQHEHDAEGGKAWALNFRIGAIRIYKLAKDIEIEVEFKEESPRRNPEDC